MFLYTIVCQQSNLVCCHNDTLACNNSKLHNYFKCIWNCECYVPCACSCVFTYFEFFGSLYNSSLVSVKCRLQIVKSQYQYAYRKVPTPELLVLFSSIAEVSGFLLYQLHTKGTELYFWSSLRCIKVWIVICHRGLSFPQRALVLLMLEIWALCKKKCRVDF